MEDPIRFDVWGTVRKGANEPAVQWLCGSFPWQTVLKVRISVNKSTTQSVPISIAERKSWSEIEMLRRDSPPWLQSFEVFQEGYKPSHKERLNYCSKHDFYSAGLGCNVCKGFYLP